jgi:tetratricopeptide (TPR) repeat protein
MIFGGDDIEERLRARVEHGDPRESAAAAISWAAVKQNRGEPAAALDLLREAVRCDDRGTRARAWLALAEFYSMMGEESGARRAFGRVAELFDPEVTPDVAIDLAARAQANGNDKGAAEIYREVLAAHPAPGLATLAALRLASIHRAADQPRLALAVLEEVRGPAESGELGIEADLVLAELLLELRDRGSASAGRAEELLESVIESDHPDHSPRAALLLARRLGARRNFSRAFELLVAVIGSGASELLAEADAELSAQVARQAEPHPHFCVPLAWSASSAPTDEEPLAAPLPFPPPRSMSPEISAPVDIVTLFRQVKIGGLPGSADLGSRHHLFAPGSDVAPRRGVETDAHHRPPRSLWVTCGLGPLDVGLQITAPGAPGISSGRVSASAIGLWRRLRDFLVPASSAHGIHRLSATEAYDAAVLRRHGAWGAGDAANLAPLLGMFGDGAHANSDAKLGEMLLALASGWTRPGLIGAGFAGLAAGTWIAALGHNLDDLELPVHRTWQAETYAIDTCFGDSDEGMEHRAVPDVFSEHRERLAVALADGIAVGPSAEAVLGISTSRTYTAAYGCVARSRAAPANSSARDDLAHLTVAFEQDLPTFLAGVLEPALERDGVA